MYQRVTHALCEEGQTAYRYGGTYYSITISLIYKVYFTLLVVLEAVPLLYTSGIS